MDHRQSFMKILEEVKIDKETYEVLNDFMNTSKMVIRDMPKNQALFEELQEYTNQYRDKVIR